jgi:hypothetical protein
MITKRNILGDVTLPPRDHVILEVKRRPRDGMFCATEKTSRANGGNILEIICTNTVVHGCLNITSLGVSISNCMINELAYDIVRLNEALSLTWN